MTSSIFYKEAASRKFRDLYDPIDDEDPEIYIQEN